MIKRMHVISTRLSEEEYKFFLDQAIQDTETNTKTGQKNMSAYVRKKLLQENGYRGDQVKKEIRELTFQIRKIGVNINQAVTKINSSFYDFETTDRLFSCLQQVNDLFENVVEELEKKDGSNQIDEY